MRSEICQQNIAWFKFAELVSRKEKERAMSMFRLLSLSWHDLGYTYLFKGDLLVAFQDDEGARAAYHKAVFEYDQLARTREAAHAYERIFMLDTTNTTVILELITRFVALDHKGMVARYCTLFRCAMRAHEQFLTEELLTEALGDFSERESPLTVDVRSPQLLLDSALEAVVSSPFYGRV